MKLKALVQTGVKLLDKNAPTILTAVAVVGVVATTVLAVKATKKAIEDLEADQLDENDHWEDFDLKSKIKLTWKHYVPVFLSASLTIGCIFGAQYVNAKRIAALATLYSVTENKLVTYQEKTKELLGKRKSEELKNSVSEETAKRNPSNDIIVTGTGSSRIYDSYTGRYFESDIEHIRRAVNELNRDLFSTMWVSLNDFYMALNLKTCKGGDEVGWNSDNMIEVTFDSMIDDDGRPCLILDYMVTPRHDYRNLH